MAASRQRQTSRVTGNLDQKGAIPRVRGTPLVNSTTHHNGKGQSNRVVGSKKIKVQEKRLLTPDDSSLSSHSSHDLPNIITSWDEIEESPGKSHSIWLTSEEEQRQMNEEQEMEDDSSLGSEWRPDLSFADVTAIESIIHAVDSVPIRLRSNNSVDPFLSGWQSPLGQPTIQSGQQQSTGSHFFPQKNEETQPKNLSTQHPSTSTNERKFSSTSKIMTAHCPSSPLAAHRRMAVESVIESPSAVSRASELVFSPGAKEWLEKVIATDEAEITETVARIDGMSLRSSLADIDVAIHSLRSPKSGAQFSPPISPHKVIMNTDEVPLSPLPPTVEEALNQSTETLRAWTNDLQQHNSKLHGLENSVIRKSFSRNLESGQYSNLDLRRPGETELSNNTTSFNNPTNNTPSGVRRSSLSRSSLFSQASLDARLVAEERRLEVELAAKRQAILAERTAELQEAMREALLRERVVTAELWAREERPRLLNSLLDVVSQACDRLFSGESPRNSKKQVAESGSLVHGGALPLSRIYIDQMLETAKAQVAARLTTEMRTVAAAVAADCEARSTAESRIRTVAHEFEALVRALQVPKKIVTVLSPEEIRKTLAAEVERQEKIHAELSVEHRALRRQVQI